MKSFTSLIVLAAGSTLTSAQTPPIQPQTPDVVIPPRVAIPGNAESRPLTVAEAVALALREQPSIDVAQGNVESARGRTEQVRAGLRPTVTATGSAGRNESIRGGTSNGSGSTGANNTSGWSTQSGVTVSQLLFDFNRTRDQVRQQAALQNAATQNLSRAKLDVVADVKGRYYDYLQNRRLTTVAEGNVANRQAQLALAQANLNAGIGAPADVVQAKTNLADAVQSLVVARNTEDLSRFALALAIGVDPLTPITVTDGDEPQVDKADPLGLVTVALTRRPEVLQARETLRAAQLGVGVAKRTNAPSLGLALGYNARGQNDPLTNQTATATLTLSWPIENGGLTAGRTEEARGNQRTAEAQLRQTTLTVTTEVSQAYLNLSNAEQRLTLANVQLANAQEGVRLAEGRYRGGVGTFLEITNAQNLLFTAQRAVEQARGDISRARAALRRATAEPVS